MAATALEVRCLFRCLVDLRETLYITSEPRGYVSSGKSNDGAIVLKARVSFVVAYVLCIYPTHHTHPFS